VKYDDIIIKKNWINSDERYILNNWALENRNKFFKNSYIGENRITTRPSTNLDFEYPTLIVEKFSKLKNDLGLSIYKNSSSGKNGIVCAITGHLGKLRNHLDPKINGYESLHFLIKTLNGGDGGEFYIKNKHYPLNEGDCLIFFASILEHEVTTLTNSGNRISWFQSVQIPINQIEN
jgi:hypothetical protein